MACLGAQDPDVCKYHLVGDCPHEMWVNQAGDSKEDHQTPCRVLGALSDIGQIRCLNRFSDGVTAFG